MNTPKLKQCFWIAAALLVAWELFLFIFMTINAPAFKVAVDSDRYLKLASALLSQGKFELQTSGGAFQYEVFRTPGYPLFLAALQGVAKFPLDSIIFVQVLLTLLATWIVYKIAMQINEKIAYLSTLIVLCDPVSSIISLRLMSETLFLPLIATFYLCFIRYLKSGKLWLLLLAALMLVAATYVHAISYYLGVAIAVFMIYANIPKDLKKNIIHIMVFLAAVYGLLGLWQLRNYMCCGETAFSSVIQHNFQTFGLLKVQFSEGWLSREGILSLIGRDLYAFALGCFAHLFRPISFKYFDWEPLHIVGNVSSYSWSIFCGAGLVAGIFKVRNNLSYQFLLWNIIYFCSAAVLSAYRMAEARMRMSFLPCVAILSAYGWFLLWTFVKKKFLMKTKGCLEHPCKK
ncbi:MAG: glycosyltransferase family 39 protein [Candidatus Omnitrophota bacterium]|jgi:hypothetical protein